MPDSFKIYRIRNRINGDEVDIGADSAQEACEKLGWMIGDCQVIILLDPDGEAHQMHLYPN